jgi:hypothetical protein
MIERRCGARFTAKPLDRLRIPRDVARKKLQGEVPPEARVPGLVDDAHTAPAELLEDGVVGDGSTQDRRCFGHGAGSLSDGHPGSSTARLRDTQVTPGSTYTQLQ